MCIRDRCVVAASQVNDHILNDNMVTKILNDHNSLTQDNLTPGMLSNPVEHRLGQGNVTNNNLTHAHVNILTFIRIIFQDCEHSHSVYINPNSTFLDCDFFSQKFLKYTNFQLVF